MTSPFAAEIDAAHAAVQRAVPNDSRGIYALPWYLVVGDPGTGRSTAVRSMNLGWSVTGEGPLRLGLPQQLCTWWMAIEGVFIEPEGSVFGPQRNPEALRALCDELKVKRPREQVDGILLVMSVADLVDLDESGLDAYAQRLRSYLTEIGRRFGADVPVYVIVTRYDTLFGFAEVFQWSAERRREEPFGFTLPPNYPAEKVPARIVAELDGLAARFESVCLAKLSSDDLPEQRTRAMQHLAEVRELVEKLRVVLEAIGKPSSFERAPWLRALAIGCAVPGTGDRPRAGTKRFANMGLAGPPPAPPGSVRPGGLPIHAFVPTVVLPEREIVPLRVRWRDDKLLVGAWIAGGVLLLATLVLALALPDPSAQQPSGKPTAVAPARR
jgi:type VI secretion system protein ImpL